MTLLSDELTNVFHKSITNYIGQNEFRTSLLFAIKEGTPAINGKQTVIDLKYFVNDEQLYQIKVLNKWSDSAGVYKAARDVLKKDKKSPFTLVGGCMAHQTNIFLKDLIVKCPEVKKAIKSAAMIATTLGQSIAFWHAVCLKVKVTVDINSITIWVPTNQYGIPMIWPSSRPYIWQTTWNWLSSPREINHTSKDRRQFQESEDFLMIPPWWRTWRWRKNCYIHSILPWGLPRWIMSPRE